MNDTTFQGDGKVAYVPVVVDTKKKSITNADRIRGMTDEELAETLARKVHSCQNCESQSLSTCCACWLDWLREEISE